MYAADMHGKRSPTRTRGPAPCYEPVHKLAHASLCGESAVMDFISTVPFDALFAAGGGAGKPIEHLCSVPAAIALVTLTILEIVLGIDNIIFISVLADKLPLEKQNKARVVGLSLAMILRILLLLSISWIMRLTTPLPVIGEWFVPVMGDDKPLNWRDTIVLL